MINMKSNTPRKIKTAEAKTYKGIYAMHKYWAKKPYNVISKFIKNYATGDKDIILDSFCGSGITAIETLKLGKKAIAIDINPMATFITNMTVLSPIDIDKLKYNFEEIEKVVKRPIYDLYKSKCHKCGSNVTITHTLWNKPAPIKIKFFCEKCNKSLERIPSENDIGEITQAQKLPIPYWYPKIRLIPNSRINVYENTKVEDLFTNRNLLALSMIYDRINKIEDEEIKNIMKFTFTSTLSQASKMVFVIRSRGKEEIGSWVAGYWTPKEFFEINAWNCFASRFKKILKGKEETNQVIDDYYKRGESFEDLKNGKSILIKTQTAEDISFIPTNSVDYIFTDPPHGDRVPYLELSYMWGAWLNLNMDFDKEIVISDRKEKIKKIKEYESGLTNSIKEMYRVLKPRKYMSIAFNNREGEIWNTFINACMNAGFEKVNMTSVDASATSVMQSTRNGALKGDIIITFKKANNKNVPSDKELKKIKHEINKLNGNF